MIITLYVCKQKWRELTFRHGGKPLTRSLRISTVCYLHQLNKTTHNAVVIQQGSLLIPRNIRGDFHAEVFSLVESHALFSGVTHTMTDSTENATPLKFTKSPNRDSSEKIQIGPIFQLEFVPLYTEESGILNAADFGGVAIAMDTVIV